VARTDQWRQPRKRKLHAHPIRGLERVLLGMMMTIVAYVVERRLVKALRKEGQPVKGDASGERLENLDVTAAYDGRRGPE